MLQLKIGMPSCCGHREAGGTSGIRSLKGIETEQRQHGAWALSAPHPLRVSWTVQVSTLCK